MVNNKVYDLTDEEELKLEQFVDEFKEHKNKYPAGVYLLNIEHLPSYTRYTYGILFNDSCYFSNKLLMFKTYSDAKPKDMVRQEVIDLNIINIKPVLIYDINKNGKCT